MSDEGSGIDETMLWSYLGQLVYGVDQVNERLDIVIRLLNEMGQKD